MLLPAVALVGLLMVFPLLVALGFSTREGNVSGLSSIWQLPATLDNYVEALTSATTWRQLWLSFVYTAGVTGPSLVIGLLVALTLNQRLFGRRWLRSIALLPWALPAVVVVITFQWMFDQAFGVMNWLLLEVHLISKPVAWFFNENTAMVAVIVPTIWKGYPFFTLIILAALQMIPGDLYEASSIDGASTRQQFRYITLPAIRAPITLATVLTILWVFREYDFIYATTQGGPNGATETLAIGIYNMAFRYFDLAMASTMGILVCVITGGVVLRFAPLLRAR